MATTATDLAIHFNTDLFILDLTSFNDIYFLIRSLVAIKEDTPMNQHQRINNRYPNNAKLLNPGQHQRPIKEQSTSTELIKASAKTLANIF